MGGSNVSFAPLRRVLLLLATAPAIESSHLPAAASMGVARVPVLRPAGAAARQHRRRLRLRLATLPILRGCRHPEAQKY